MPATASSIATACRAAVAAAAATPAPVPAPSSSLLSKRTWRLRGATSSAADRRFWPVRLPALPSSLLARLLPGALPGAAPERRWKTSSWATLSLRPSWLKWMKRCLTAGEARRGRQRGVERSEVQVLWCTWPSSDGSAARRRCVAAPQARTRAQHVGAPEHGQAVAPVAGALGVHALVAAGRQGACTDRRRRVCLAEHAPSRAACMRHYHTLPCRSNTRLRSGARCFSIPTLHRTRAAPAPPGTVGSGPPPAGTPRRGGAPAPRCGGQASEHAGCVTAVAQAGGCSRHTHDRAVRANMSTDNGAATGPHRQRLTAG